MTRLACAAWAFVAVSLVAITPVASQPAPVPASAAKSAVSAAPSAARAVPATSAVPAAAGSALPAGHPATTAAGMPAGHGGAGGNRRAGIFRPRQNLVVVSEEVEPGIADVMIVDADERPLAGLPITLAILRSSVTKGEARSTREAVTDQQGRAMFRDLAVGSGMSYTLKAKRGEAEFASQPFGMKHKHGVKVLLHAYRPVTELSEAVVVMESIVALDIKEDSIAVNQLVRGLNLGRTAYVAKNVSMKLPPNFKAYNNQTSAGGVAMVERDGFAHLQGTFPPGSSEMTFRYQVPLTGDSSQTLKLPLPPRIVQTTIMVSAGPSMGLNVSGFPAARATRRRDGQRVLQTSKQVNPSAGIQQFLANTEPGLLEVTISGIPTPGPARWIAVALGVMAVLAG
ncbi:MAG TPA: hypothetical protein ENK23_03755, partial [Sorangium sp.]|nr:hypothetical protein [Sorangium sp.]